MNEIIDALIDLIHALKYGYAINSRRNYRKLIQSCHQLRDDEGLELKHSVLYELSHLKIDFYAKGVPAYIFLEVKNNRFRVYALSANYEFLCRLEDRGIESLPVMGSSYYFVIPQ